MRLAAALVGAALACAACSADTPRVEPAATTPTPVVEPVETTATTTTTTPTTTPTTTTTIPAVEPVETTTSIPAVEPVETTTTIPAVEPVETTTTVADPFVQLDLTAPVVTLGESVERRPIVAERHGELGGRRVLVIGVIHGDEDAGVAIVDDLSANPVADGVELWLVESMNPDGQAAHDRHNANHVDLNRNFPYNWGPLGVPGDGQYAGPGPASEPETQAIINLITRLRPDITIWYHQDLYTISPSTGRDGRIRARYAELTGLPLGEITGGTYTGVAATWARRELEPHGSVAFIVELGPTLSPDEAGRHADAVRTIATEG